MAYLNLEVDILGYEDQPVTSAPQLAAVGPWHRSLRGVAVDHPGRVPVPTIPAGGSATILNGTRTLTLDGTTTFSVVLSLLDPTQYFLSWTGGTAPGFRVDRGLTLSGSTLSVTPQNNGSVLFSVTSGGGTFTGVLVGDQVFIPGISTGTVSGPFNPVNEGLWQVLSITDSTHIVLVRPSGSLLGAYPQVGVVITANLQFQAFSAAGVQPGDQVDISLGASLPSPLISTFNVLAVTAQQLVLQSTNPLPAVTGLTPTAAGLVVYSQAYNFLYLEADQPCAVQVNGDSGQAVRVTPWNTGGSCSCAGSTTPIPGSFMKVGPTWSLTVVNRSINPLNLLLITAE